LKKASPDHQHTALGQTRGGKSIRGETIALSQRHQARRGPSQSRGSKLGGVGFSGVGLGGGGGQQGSRLHVRPHINEKAGQWR